MWHKVSIDQLINSEPPYNDHIPDKRSFNLGSNCFVLLQCDNKRAKAITARKVFTRLSRFMSFHDNILVGRVFI